MGAAAWSVGVIVGFIIGYFARRDEAKRLSDELANERRATDFMVARLADIGINMDKTMRQRALDIALERRREARSRRSPASIRGWVTRRENDASRHS